jgi:hypothetical protein
MLAKHALAPTKINACRALRVFSGMIYQHKSLKIVHARSVIGMMVQIPLANCVITLVNHAHWGI